MKKNKVIVFVDGGARGNPGPASIGVVIEYDGKKNEYAEQIGETTNNVAEYKALVFALKKTRQLIGKKRSKETKVSVNSDSELMVSQLRGEYKIKNEALKTLFVEVWNLMQDFEKVELKLVPRNKNKDADRLVNRVLDTLI